MHFCQASDDILPTSVSTAAATWTWCSSWSGLSHTATCVALRGHVVKMTIGFFNTIHFLKNAQKLLIAFSVEWQFQERKNRMCCQKRRDVGQRREMEIHHRQCSPLVSCAETSLFQISFKLLVGKNRNQYLINNHYIVIGLSKANIYWAPTKNKMLWCSEGCLKSDIASYLGLQFLATNIL